MLGRSTRPQSPKQAYFELKTKPVSCGHKPMTALGKKSLPDSQSVSPSPEVETSLSKAAAENSQKKALMKMSILKAVPIVYHRCLDVDAMKRRYDSIKTRVWQNHVVKAYEIYELAENLKMQEATTKDQIDTDAMSEDSYRGASEIFEDVNNVHDRSKPFRPQIMFHDTKKKKKDASISARKLGLTKQEEFTGKEAQALRKLLKSLRTKTWDPELYLQIRYFSIRHQLQDPEAKELVRKRWFYVIRMLSLVSKIGMALAERCFERASACVTYCDMVADAIRPICWGPGGTLPFDKDAYTTNTNIMISLDALTTVRDKKPADRSPEEIERCVLSLQYVHSFAKLPTNIQHSLVARAFNLGVKEKRVIIKQGHIPQYFYFVLSGQAFSKRFLPNGKTETTAVLRRGDGFGTAAIFNKCRRLVTVVSQTPMQLLVVPRECLVESFINLDTDPYADNIQFLQKMWFMHTWPIEVLIKCPSQCGRKQFRRTEIIEHDAALSKWIYIVSSPKGICRVFKRIPLSTTPAINNLHKVHRHLTLESVPLLLGTNRNLIEVPNPESRPPVLIVRSPSTISQCVQSQEKKGKENVHESSSDNMSPLTSLLYLNTARSVQCSSSSGLLVPTAAQSSQLDQTEARVTFLPTSQPQLRSGDNEGTRACGSQTPLRERESSVATPRICYSAGTELTTSQKAGQTSQTAGQTSQKAGQTSQTAGQTSQDTSSAFSSAVHLTSSFKSSHSVFEAERRRQAFYQNLAVPKHSMAVQTLSFLDDKTQRASVKFITRQSMSGSRGKKSAVTLRARDREEEREAVTYKAHSLLSLLYNDPNFPVYSMTVSAKDDDSDAAEQEKVKLKKQIKDIRAFDLCMPGLLPGSDLASSVVCHIPVLRKANKPMATTKYDYRLVTTLRYLDVFGLEDIVLDPHDPPHDRNLILISDSVECVMLSKSFYLRQASVTLRKKVLARLKRHQETYRQVTHYDCSMIGQGGIQLPKDCVLDPLQPAYCIHC